MKTAKKIAFDVGWAFTGSIFVLLLHFLQKPIMARYLGPDGLGLFSMVTMIAGIIALIAGVEINGAVVKYVAEYKDDKRKLNAVFSSAFITVAIFGVVASVVLFVFSDKLAGIFDMPALSYLLKIYAFVLPFSLMYGVILGFLNGLREMKYYSLFNTLNGIMIFLFIVTFLFLGFGVVGAVIGDMLALIVVMGMAGIVMKKFVRFTLSDYRKNTKKLTSFGSRLVGANMITQVLYQVDTIMIGYFLTSMEVGYYAVAISLSRFFLRIPSAVQTITYPVISEYWAKKDYQSINKLVDKSTKYSAILLSCCGMIVIFFANDLITLLFTSEFMPAVVPLIILVIGTVVSGTLRSVGSIFASVGKVHLILRVTVIVALGDVLLNLILIPIYGINGAAAATTATSFLGVIVHIYFMRTIVGIKLDTFWYVKLAIVIGISAILFYEFAFLTKYVSAIIALLFYIVVVIVHFLTEEDRKYFISFIRKH